MNPAQLEIVDSDSSPFFRRIKVCCYVDLPPTQILASPRLMPLFTSIHVETVEMDFFETVVSSFRLAVDNPFLTEADWSNLDERGLIRPGTRIGNETVLASVLGVLEPRSGVPKTSPGMQRVRDESLRAPFGWGGAVVTSSQFLQREGLEAGTPKNVVGRVRIELRAERPLTPGDLLFVAPSMKPLAPLARFAELADGVDLLVGLVVGLRLHLQPNVPCECLIAKGEVRADDVLRARSIGPYSLISKQPLSGRFHCPGQPFSADNAQWLASHQLTGILKELTAFNCEQGADSSAFAPYSLHVLASHLQAMGLNVDIGSEGNHVSLRLSPSLDEESISRSSGEIKKPETINYRTYKPERGGMFCEDLYGPEDSVFRDRRFGHLKLPVDIVPFLYRMGSPSLLEQTLNISSRDLNALIEYEACIIPEENGFRIAEIDQKDLPVLSQTGGHAVRTLLSAVREENLPPGLRGRATLLVTRTLLVLPPDLRPLVLLQNGNFATSDLNDHYRRVINRANRLRKLLEMKAPQLIIFSECRFLQHAVDSLFCNQFLKSAHRVNGSQNRPLVDLSDLVASTFLDKKRKLEDYSARARVVMDAESLPGTALIPRSVFSTLELEPDVPVIIANADGVSGIVAAMPLAHDDPVVRLPESAFVHLRFLRSPDPQCIIFRMRTAAGIADARLLMSDPIDLDAPNVEPSPLDVQSHADLIEVLVAHISAGNPLHLNSASGLLVGGSGAVEFAEPQVPSAVAGETREIAIPPGSTTTRRD